MDELMDQWIDGWMDDRLVNGQTVKMMHIRMDR